MDKSAPPKGDKTPQTSPEAPFTTFIHLDEKSPVPSAFRTPGTFTIVRLQSSAGFPDRITKLSPVPALLVSISLKPLPSSSYQVWASDKLIRTSVVRPFRCRARDLWYAGSPETKERHDLDAAVQFLRLLSASWQREMSRGRIQSLPQVA